MSIGKRIKFYRIRSGYTQEKLAGCLAVTPKAISKWENDHALPDVYIFARMAKLFDVTCDRLIAEE